MATQLDLFGPPREDPRPIVAFVKRITLRNGRVLIAPPGRAFAIRAKGPKKRRKRR